MTVPYTGVKWGDGATSTSGGKVTWSFATSAARLLTFDSYLSDSSYQTIVRTAFDTWEEVANIDFVEVSDNASSKIRLGWENGDGDYGMLGEASWQYSGQTTVYSEVVFDRTDTWKVGDSKTGIDFYAVAVHEIGHAIGLDHSDETSSIMYPYLGNQTGLSNSDVGAIARLYGANPAQATSAPKSIEGTYADDKLTGVSKADTINGREGNDTINGAGGGDTLHGNDGSDTLFGGGDNDRIYGDAGNDTLIGETGGDALSGGDGTDIASYYNSGAGVTANLLKSGDNLGDARGDTYSSIENLAGSDYNDTLVGNGGGNTLNGDDGDDKLYANEGNDTLIGGRGGDKLSGGDGMDTASYHNSSAGITVNLVKPGDNLGEARGDTFSSIENLVGSRYDDKLYADDARNTVNGGLGNDTLYGGKGDDVFVFDSALGAANTDTIKSFSAKDDLFVLDEDIFTMLGRPGVLDEDAFHASSRVYAGDADDRIIYNSKSGDLFYDVDGTGSADSVKFAHVDAGLSLSFADFLIGS